MSERNQQIESFVRFLERRTHSECYIVPIGVIGGGGDLRPRKIRRARRDGFDASERDELINDLARQPRGVMLIAVTDGRTARFEVGLLDRPEVRVFFIDAAESLVEVLQGSAEEAVYYWTRSRLRYGRAQPFALNPRPVGPKNSYQPVFVPIGQFS